MNAEKKSICSLNGAMKFVPFPSLEIKFFFFSMNIICKHDNVLIVYFHKDNVALIFIPCK